MATTDIRVRAAMPFAAHTPPGAPLRDCGVDGGHVALKGVVHADDRAAIGVEGEAEDAGVGHKALCGLYLV
jgi:hypothetical protein